MKKVQTPAPISIEDLKLYFEDKETFYNINYTTSSIKGDKLLVYISNLDIPCDIITNSEDETIEILEAYLNSSFLVNLPSLESKVISLLLQHKEIIPVEDIEILDQVKDKLDSWTEKLESLPLFNMYSVNDKTMKGWVVNEHKTDDTQELTGVNFVSLLKHESFYLFYEKFMFEPKYYSAYFNEYMFKGNNLYSFWANKNNPMFLLTHAIATGQIDLEKYNSAMIKSLEELS